MLKIKQERKTTKHAYEDKKYHLVLACKVKQTWPHEERFEITKIEKQTFDVLFLSSPNSTYRNFSRQ
jgi:hypothetical protein